MEIDIPDLDDLEFTTRCRSCGGDGTIPEDPRKVKQGLPKRRTCYMCDGSGVRLTRVGERLMEFLGKLGVHFPMPEGWKVKE